MKHILGVSAGFHDAALCLLDTNGHIVFAGHSERYSKQKNDADLCAEIVSEIYGADIDTVAYYERPWIKQARNWYSGQGIDWHNLTTRSVLQKQLAPLSLNGCKIKNYNHHLCHAAAGFQTSPYDRATVVVIDAVGEWDTVTIWGAQYDRKGQARYKRLWSQRYPHSIGLFYSAVTDRVGLRPMDEEYITMGMSAWGQPCWTETMHNHLVADVARVEFSTNLHAGLDLEFLAAASNEDLAASAQQLAETLIYSVMKRAAQFHWSTNLVYMGGVALNCLANRNLGRYFDSVWIMPCPGDAGSSIGAAALAYQKKLHWKDAYLGHDITGPYPVDALIDHLINEKIVGVASGRAEFGPRALGNRSLLADPRGTEIKDQVNGIKRRQKFRPFAPVILAELADQYFDMPQGWHTHAYMQTVARCRRPDLFPAICHVDGTSRVQTVSTNGSGIRLLLEAWYAKTGCPMLLNTSLNIRGEPMVNDRRDANRFEYHYGVPVCS